MKAGNSEGRVYLEIRHRLVGYFDRNNCLEPNELAGKTLNRVARRLEEEGVIETETPASSVTRPRVLHEQTSNGFAMRNVRSRVTGESIVWSWEGTPSPAK